MPRTLKMQVAPGASVEAFSNNKHNNNNDTNNNSSSSSSSSNNNNDNNSNDNNNNDNNDNDRLLGHVRLLHLRDEPPARHGSNPAPPWVSAQREGGLAMNFKWLA